MKTYLLNQNGETVIKQKNNKQTVQQKNTLENKLLQRKMSILARKQKELANQFPNFKNNSIFFFKSKFFSSSFKSFWWFHNWF